MLAQQYTIEARPASILPALDVSSVAWFINPNGSTVTGQIEGLDFVEGMWWASCRYELTPGFWVLENRHAHNFFAGVAADFSHQIGQPVWFKLGRKWQAAVIVDFNLDCGEWFAVMEFCDWFGESRTFRPLAEVRTTAPALSEDAEYSEWLKTIAEQVK